MDIELSGLGPGDAEWLVDQHGQAYASSEGFDDTFAVLVAQILADFEARHDETCERAFVAWAGTKRLGSVFCVRVTAKIAKLRLFYLVEDARGHGLGQRLLDACTQFARDSGYDEMRLWTHESHKAACALYARNGWQLLSSKPVHSFGVDLVEQAWRIDLTPEV
ncbi:GNAT family N-acetyltransferase [uncultured Pelagimonas sp.]|uniref:GNAT family N-acetyltransferase n=1 Tax=uncultured Pelagimonas sp. TaxID=1618102 RepID=UPI002604D341|nr:GNAT family N-acetyltransferase [uncultured Pelagimonas sp.]